MRRLWQSIIFCLAMEGLLGMWVPGVRMGLLMLSDGVSIGVGVLSAGVMGEVVSGRSSL